MLLRFFSVTQYSNVILFYFAHTFNDLHIRVSQVSPYFLSQLNNFSYLFTHSLLL